MPKYRVTGSVIFADWIEVEAKDVEEAEALGHDLFAENMPGFSHIEIEEIEEL